MILPLPLSHDEMMQFLVTYLGDASVCSTLQSACYSVLHKRGRNTSTSTDRGVSSRRRKVIVMTSLAGIVILMIVRMALFQNSDASGESETYKTTNLRKSKVDFSNTILKRRLKVSSSTSAASTTNNSNNPPAFDTNFKPNGQTVIAVGVSNDIFTYKQFVGSLRHSGYQGTIILGRPRNSPRNSPRNNPHHRHPINMHDDRNDAIIHNYLVSQNVMIQYMDVAYGDECKSNLLLQDERLLQQQQKQQQQQQPQSQSQSQSDSITTTACIKPHTNLKLGWTGHALARDWLKQCPPRTCTGPTLLSPLHHVYFQSNPFQSLLHNRNQLFLEFYEDHPSKSINDNFALEQCKKFMWENVPFVKSFVYADLMSMKFYLEEIVKESYDWMNMSQCYLSNTGIAIHNYLLYNGVIRPSFVFEDRVGWVHSIGQRSKEMRKMNESDKMDWMTNVSIPLRQQKIVNEDGYFLNWDGSLSPIVHQTNAYGKSYQRWMQQQPFMKLSEEELHNNKKRKENSRNIGE